jgi:hypothetical protein
MSDDPIFTDFQPHHAQLWGQTPLRMSHRLHESTLFRNEALGGLIDKYPRDSYSLVQWGEQTAERGSWREGELGGMPGVNVVDAIAKGRIWINLRDVGAVDGRYGELRDAIFAELRSRIPGYDMSGEKIGILISSPGSRTNYHADLPGQCLWQIRGVKRVYVYPPNPPFLRPEHVEGIALTGVEVNMPYQPWYDEHATVYDLEPGQMLHWPLNAPHRVDNHDCLNVSMTMEYFTDEIRRSHIVTMANGILRHKMGYAPVSRATSGPAFWTKAVFQKAMKKTPWVKRENRPRKPSTFMLDRSRPGAIVDIPQQAAE